MTDETLIVFGSQVKSLDGGKVGGYLVRFTGPNNPDLEGDFFTKSTDFDFEGERRVSVYYHHGLDPTLKNRRLGRGVARIDDVGVWVEAQLELADEYAAAVLDMVKQGKVGWSSGAVAHLVAREDAGKAWRITHWPIGEASITPTPAAGPKLTQVTTLKALIPEAAEDTATDAGADGDNADETQTKAEREPNKGDIEMSDETKAPAIDLSPVLDRLDAIAEENKALKERLQKVEETPVNPIKAATGKAPAVIGQRGDNFSGSFRNWARTGSDDGLKSMIDGDGITLKGDMLYPQVKASNDTDMNIGTDADGGYLVPTGFFNEIIARRDESSLVSRLPLRRIPGVGTTVNVPIDSEADGEFITKAEATAFDRDAPALGEKALTLVKYTKTIQVSDELMQDTPTNLMSFLAEWVGRGMAKTDNNLLLTEVAANGTALKTFASASAIAFGEPEDIVYNNDLSAYLEDDNAAAWVMRASTLGDIKSIVGSDRQYAMNMGNDGRQLLGYPVYYSQKAAAVGASAKPVYFGNWRYVAVRYGPGLTFLRNPYLLANSGQLALHYYYRVVFGVLQAEAIGYGVHPSS